MPDVDPAFLALPLRQCADAALQVARDGGVEHASFRVHRLRSQGLSLRDARLEGSIDGEDVGLAVRVLVRGTWGFAAGVEVTPDEAAQMLCDAMIDKPKRMASRLGTFGEVLYAISPKTVDIVLNTAYNLFPDSAAAKKRKEGDKKPAPADEKKEDGEMSTEAVAMAKVRIECAAASDISSRAFVLTLLMVPLYSRAPS